MALDNSWLVMNEEEMYDVNGGWSLGGVSLAKSGWFPVGVYVTINNLMASDVAWMVVAVAGAIAGISRVAAVGWTAGAVIFFGTLFATNDELEETNLIKSIKLKVSFTGVISLVSLTV
jgi:hypothetical protein